MDRRNFSLTAIGAVVLGGCGGGSGGGFVGAPVVGTSAPSAPPDADELPGPEFAGPTALPAGVAFLQTTGPVDGRQMIAPNQATGWDLMANFAIYDGGGDQFDGALELSVVVAGNEEQFPRDQYYRDLVALGPEMGDADGVKLVSFTDDSMFIDSQTLRSLSNRSYAFLHPGVDVRLQQTLDLTAVTGGVTLKWAGARSERWRGRPTRESNKGEIDGIPHAMQVVVRDAARGEVLAILYRVDWSAGVQGAWGEASLTPFVGRVVILSFEKMNHPYAGMLIGNVSVRSTEAPDVEIVTNGNFEAQDAGWHVPSNKVSQNVRSGLRALHGFHVQRTFYTQPNQLWGRFADVFHNATASAIRSTVVYTSHLGSGGIDFIYPTSKAIPQQALTGLELSSACSSSHCCFVFGAADAVQCKEDSDKLEFQFNIEIPPGGTVTLVNFILLRPVAKDRKLPSGMDIGARSMDLDALAIDIAKKFRTKFVYQRGLTQAQLGSLRNF